MGKFLQVDDEKIRCWSPAQGPNDLQALLCLLAIDGDDEMPEHVGVLPRGKRAEVLSQERTPPREHLYSSNHPLGGEGLVHC
jgi:hypothetical protein